MAEALYPDRRALCSRLRAATACVSVAPCRARLRHLDVERRAVSGIGKRRRWHPMCPPLGPWAAAALPRSAWSSPGPEPVAPRAAGAARGGGTAKAAPCTRGVAAEAGVGATRAARSHHEQQQLARGVGARHEALVGVLGVR